MLDSDLRLSKLRFYSCGIVAANKPLGQDNIEVIPVEDLPFLDGEISSNQEKIESTGVDISGANYKTGVITSNAIQATWLKLSVSNRVTSPDVRRNEIVMIYQFGDTPKYYWTTLKDDMKYRRLETVVWGISATSQEDVTLDNTNMYYFEMSSHRKHVTLHTSKANGEPFEYTLQINTGEGSVTITDDGGNWVQLDSAARRLQMVNADGSSIDMNKKNLTISVPETIRLNCKNYVLSASEASTSNVGNSVSTSTKTFAVSASSGSSFATPNLAASSMVSTPNVAAGSSLTVGGTEMAYHTHGGITRGIDNTDPV